MYDGYINKNCHTRWKMLALFRQSTLCYAFTSK